MKRTRWEELKHEADVCKTVGMYFLGCCIHECLREITPEEERVNDQKRGRALSQAEPVTLSLFGS